MGLRLGSTRIPGITLYEEGKAYPKGLITIDATTSDTFDVTNYAFAKVTNIPKPVDYFAQYAADTLVSYSSSNVTSLPIYAFCGRSNLEEVDFPACTTISSSAFLSCSALTTASFPACTSIGVSAFRRCYSLTSINFPVCTSIGSYTFQECTSLTTASFPSCTTIGTYAFGSCYNLLSLYLLGSSLCFLAGMAAFTSTPISTYTASTGGVYGSIYVPASLLASYKAATNWVRYSSRFVGV